MTHRKTTITAVLALFLGLVLGAQNAAASSKQDVFFEAPRDLTASTATDATRARAFDDMASLGVKALRVNLRWSDVAPSPDQATEPSVDMSDPATYNWGAHARVIDRAKANGWTVLISLASPVPKWATESRADNVTRPIASEFRPFAAAAARRFGAPNVLWSVWNEPNLNRFLKPQVSAGKPVSPLIYRALYLAGYAGIKTDAGQATAKVLFGETAPVGGARLVDRVYPLVFLRQALCLTTKYKLDTECGGRIPIDGVAHHPYQFSNLAKLGAGDVTYRSQDRLIAFLDKAARGGAIPSATPVYYTEFGIQSLPDTTFGVTPSAQYQIRARAERVAYYSKRIRGFSQYLLTDDSDTIGFQTGLRYASGKGKPAYKAFRLTLDAKRVGRGKRQKTSLWGLVRIAKAKTRVSVEVSTGRGFKRLKAVTTNNDGVFVLTDRYRKNARYRMSTRTQDGVYVSPSSVSFAGWWPPNWRPDTK